VRRFLRNNRLLPSLVAIPAVLLLGIWLGGHPNGLPGPLQSWLVDDDVRTLAAGLDTIEDDFVRPVGSSHVVDDALGGAVSGLDDRYSRYLDRQEYRRSSDALEGTFAGIGITAVTIKSGLRVAEVYPHSPAKRAGILAGDVIVTAAGRSLRNRPDGYGADLIRGRPGTHVRIVLVRRSAGKPRRRSLRLRRARVDIPVVQAHSARYGGKRLGVVALSSFTSGAHGEVRGSVDRQLALGAKGIVLDLRHNGGGLLEEGVLVASIFVPEGTVVSTDGRSRSRKVYSATGNAIPQRIPVVVLVDSATASAAEIVTGALQDTGRALVVGTHTYGKGVFQQITPLPNGGAIELTVGEYFTPSGRNLGGGGSKRGRGVLPDVRAADRPRTKRDEALRVALATLARRVKTAR
jgi:carboxyl-terminal processing protease